jgi:hypothetical protein
VTAKPDPSPLGDGAGFAGDDGPNDLDAEDILTVLQVRYRKNGKRQKRGESAMKLSDKPEPNKAVAGGLLHI